MRLISEERQTKHPGKTPVMKRTHLWSLNYKVQAQVYNNHKWTENLYSWWRSELSVSHITLHNLVCVTLVFITKKSDLALSSPKTCKPDHSCSSFEGFLSCKLWGGVSSWIGFLGPSGSLKAKETPRKMFLKPFKNKVCDTAERSNGSGW